MLHIVLDHLYLVNVSYLFFSVIFPQTILCVYRCIGVTFTVLDSVLIQYITQLSRCTRSDAPFYRITGPVEKREHHWMLSSKTYPNNDVNRKRSFENGQIREYLSEMVNVYFIAMTPRLIENTNSWIAPSLDCSGSFASPWILLGRC